MQTTISERLNEIIHRYYKGNQAKFCAATGISTSKVSAWCNNKFEPKFESLVQIIKAHPNMSMRWFLLDEGDVESAELSRSNNAPCENCAELQKQIAELKQDKERLWNVINESISKK